MKKFELKQRVFNTKTFYRHLKRLVESLPILIPYKLAGKSNGSFTEKIMLAVTEVNGCRYCNYLHTKLALKAGVAKEDIQKILNGQFEDISLDEAPALIFAQHYADTGGNPDAEAYQTLVDFYGEEKAKEILAEIKTIMVGNIYGLSIDALISRIKKKPLPGSRMRDELFIVIGVVVFVPIIMTQLLVRNIFKISAVGFNAVKKCFGNIRLCP